MNSTGVNALRSIFTRPPDGGGTTVFDQPGRIEHFTNSTGARLVQQSTLIANAAVTVDLTQTYVTGAGGDERRLNYTETSALEGSGAVTVLGTPSNPTDVGLGISLNEFEIGSTAEPGTIQTDTTPARFPPGLCERGVAGQPTGGARRRRRQCPR